MIPGVSLFLTALHLDGHLTEKTRRIAGWRSLPHRFPTEVNEATYRQANFLMGVHSLAQLPPDRGREVAFAGRSNAGKSSVLNTLVGNRKLARISKTPGRTQQINFFGLAEDLRLVDLPGYGYARVAAAKRKHWGKTVSGYMKARESLCGIVIIMDARHPMTELDLQMLEWSGATGTPVHVLLNKADKLSPGAARLALQKARREPALAGAGVQLFSATAGSGVRELRAVVDRWLMKPRPAGG